MMQDFVIIIKEIKIIQNDDGKTKLQIMTEEKLISGIDKIKALI